MKKIIFCLSVIILTTNWAFSQCNMRTTHLPNGDSMKFLSPKPVIKKSGYEVGISIYKNIDTGNLSLNISVAFKTKTPQKQTGNAIIQTNNGDKLTLKPVLSRLAERNGLYLAVSLYLITKRDYEILKNNPLKSVFFHLQGDLTGNTVKENEDLLQSQLNCFEF